MLKYFPIRKIVKTRQSPENDQIAVSFMEENQNNILRCIKGSYKNQDVDGILRILGCRKGHIPLDEIKNLAKNEEIKTFSHYSLIRDVLCEEKDYPYIIKLIDSLSPIDYIENKEDKEYDDIYLQHELHQFITMLFYDNKTKDKDPNQSIRARMTWTSKKLSSTCDDGFSIYCLANRLHPITALSNLLHDLPLFMEMYNSGGLRLRSIIYDLSPDCDNLNLVSPEDDPLLSYTIKANIEGIVGTALFFNIKLEDIVEALDADDNALWIEMGTYGKYDWASDITDIVIANINRIVPKLIEMGKIELTEEEKEKYDERGMAMFWDDRPFWKIWEEDIPIKSLEYSAYEGEKKYQEKMANSRGRRGRTKR